MSYRVEEQNSILVTWCIPTTLYKHRWWKRLEEFLEEDFPAENIECIFLNTQDEEFEEKAKKAAKKMVESLSFIKDVKKKFKNVRFIGVKSNTFNLPKVRNLCLKFAKGDIVINRDADCALIQYGFTKFMVKNLIKYRLGLLSVPSLRNGVHFKPKPEYFTYRHPRYNNLTLTCSANGMATAILKDVLIAVGGFNEALELWGEHISLNVKLARAGFIQAYADNNGYWLVTSDEESQISLTDDKRNSRALINRQLGVYLMNRFYKVTKDDIFYYVQRHFYGVKEEDISEEIKKKGNKLWDKFCRYQALSPEIEMYSFKPWECFHHPKTEEYIANAYDLAKKYYERVEDRVKVLGLKNFIGL